MIRNLLVFFTCALFVSACNLLPKKQDSKGSVARVYDKYLYAKELNGLVPAGTSSKDSLNITQNYINNWIRQELLLHQAEANLDDIQMNFTQQVEQYRNSLIIFQYESELVKQKLDTNITMQEIEDYYKQNQSNFLLHENIIRNIYVSVRKSSPHLPRFRQLIRSERDADKEKLMEFCQMYAETYQLDDQAWTSFNEFVSKVPVAAEDQRSFLERNPYFEVQDSTFQYLVRIKEFKIKESVSPLSFEAANIRVILLNKRKSEMLSRMEEDLFKAAQQKKNIEIY
ncbi:MAG: hypothetical protein IPH45_08330 [Bacteroidales bacterium]|nr:hypothetical protein [Bacteroidales bacterium]MBK7174739.1 hypothetical protein [Bacteroidales bacterium]